MISYIFHGWSGGDDAYRYTPPNELNFKLQLGSEGNFGVTGTTKFIENNDATQSI